MSIKKTSTTRKPDTLTARFVDGVTPRSTRQEYFDGDVPGLVLRVTPSGVKTWAVLYRHRARRRRITLGTTAAFTLAQARERARDVLYAAGKGADPATEKQEARKAETIKDLADLYLEKWAIGPGGVEKPRKRSWKADANLLRNKVLPKWQHRTIAEIKRADVRDLVESVAEAGAPIVANRVRSLLSKMFAYALDRDLIESSPAVRIPRPGVEQARDRVLSEDEIRAVWQSFEALDPSMCAFYKLRLLTAQRGGEVVSMRWQDVDLDRAWWTIPATIAKNKKAHRVPLNASALAIVKALKPSTASIATERSAYVLAGARGKRQQAEAAATFTIANFRGHDLRRTVASTMASHGIPRLTISKLLNHVERTVTGTYDRYSYDAEKAAALTWWDVTLVAILENRAATILPFQRGA